MAEQSSPVLTRLGASFTTHSSTWQSLGLAATVGPVVHAQWPTMSHFRWDHAKPIARGLSKLGQGGLGKYLPLDSVLGAS
jgi:hypothetical protein